MARPGAAVGIFANAAAICFRVWLPIVSRNADDPCVCAAGRFGYSIGGDAVSPEKPWRKRKNPYLYVARVSGAEGFCVVRLLEPGAAGGGDQDWCGTFSAKKAADDGDFVLAVERLLARGVVVEHGLLRAMEGAAILYAAIL